MSLVGNDLIIPLNRPEYVAIPEGFLSALAWSAYEVAGLVKPADGKKLGLRFHQDSPAQSGKAFTITSTEPVEEKLVTFQRALGLHGVEALDPQSTLGSAVLQSVRGTSSEKSSQIPASPLTPSLALMQNSVGLQSKQNPPDVAEILETMFDLGSGSLGGATVASLLIRAYDKRLEVDPILKAIDTSVNEVVWSGGAKVRVGAPARNIKGKNISAYLSDTPFDWFAQSWTRLTSPDWVEALPARVWVDWATTTLRTIYAMGFLWETTWYESLAREILKPDSDKRFELESVLKGQESPITWKPNSSGAEIRDLSSKLKWRCFRSVDIRQLLEVWLKKDNRGELALSECITLMRADQALRAGLTSALNREKSSDSGPGKNLWEAIRYTLLVRERGDHYGFFRTPGSRFLFAEPGSEWLAVMVSLAAKGPGTMTDLGVVAESLHSMGASPDPKDLLGLLEKSGLARGSADADLGVQVETAFGGN